MSFLSPLINFFFPLTCIACSENLVSEDGGKNCICTNCLIAIDEYDRKKNLFHRCIRCSGDILSEEKICMRCRSTDYSFEKNISIWNYQDEKIKQIIHNYKFSGTKKASYFLAGSIFAAAQQNGMLTIPVVPAPCSRKRLKTYGWDHMNEIGRILKKYYKLKVFNLFSKLRTRDQKELNYQERQKALDNRIIINKKKASESLATGKKAVIIDDVFTTGATSEYCTRLLISCGFQSVNIITIAID